MHTGEEDYTHGMDGQHQDVDESIKMTEDRDKWRKFVHAVAHPRIEDVSKNRTECNRSTFKCMKHG